MRIEVVGRHMQITDAIRQYAETKAAKLVKFFDGTQQVTVLMEQIKQEFHVEVQVDVVKHDDFVANATSEDLYACIDMAVDKAVRQVTDYKEKLKLGKR